MLVKNYCLISRDPLKMLHVASTLVTRSSFNFTEPHYLIPQKPWSSLIRSATLRWLTLLRLSKRFSNQIYLWASYLHFPTFESLIHQLLPNQHNLYLSSINESQDHFSFTLYRLHSTQKKCYRNRRKSFSNSS